MMTRGVLLAGVVLGVACARPAAEGATGIAGISGAQLVMYVFDAPAAVDDDVVTRIVTTTNAQEHAVPSGAYRQALPAGDHLVCIGKDGPSDCALVRVESARLTPVNFKWGAVRRVDVVGKHAESFHVRRGEVGDLCKEDDDCLEGRCGLRGRCEEAR